MTEPAQPPSDESIASIHRNGISGGESVSDPAVDSRTIAGNAPDSGGGHAAASAGESLEEVTSMVQQPAKVMRIGTMIKQLLEEVRAAPLDESGRARLRQIHESSITELEQGLAPDLQAELHRLSLPFGDGVPSEAELRIAQAQLVGWLEGLFHGIQAAFAQQVAVRQHELEERRALPGGPGEGGPGRVVIGPGGQIIAIPGVQGPGQGPEGGPGGAGTGQYL
jgi:Protein of unknown function (DUF2587)